MSRGLSFPVLVIAAFVAGFFALRALPDMRVMTVSVRPMQASADVPTFAQVTERLQREQKAVPIRGAVPEPYAGPGGPNEPRFVGVRDSARASLLKKLDSPPAELCSTEGRARLLSSMKEYYWHRSTQELTYPNRWGAEGAAYIKAQWSTSDDQRIERLTAEAYGRGLFKLDDFKSTVRERIARIVAGQKPSAAPCGA